MIVSIAWCKPSITFRRCINGVCEEKNSPWPNSWPTLGNSESDSTSRSFSRSFSSSRRCVNGVCEEQTCVNGVCNDNQNRDAEDIQRTGPTRGNTEFDANGGRTRNFGPASGDNSWPYGYNDVEFL